LYGIQIWADLSSVLSGITRVTDGETDGRTEFSSLYRVCITCSAVKNEVYKTVIGDIVAHIKPQKFTVSSDWKSGTHPS